MLSGSEVEKLQESEDRVRNAIIASAVSDLVAIRIFNAQQKKHIRVAFFYYFRNLRRNVRYNHLTNETLRIKIIRMLCKRVTKINLFSQEAETIFGYTDTHKQMLHRVKSMSIIELGKLKRKGVIFTKIDLRTKEIIVL